MTFFLSLLSSPPVAPSLDLESARRVLEQAAIHQRVPRPRLGEWWRDVLTRVAEFVAGIFDLSTATIRSLLTVASWGLIALAAVVLLGWAVSFLLRLRAAREAPASAGTTVSVSLEDAAAEDWERRLRDALAGANISEALRAQWQVLFTRLPAPTSADRSGQRPANRPVDVSRCEGAERQTGHRTTQRVALAGAALFVFNGVSIIGDQLCP